MSTPPFLRLPPGVRQEALVTSRGTFSALRAGPDPDAADRCTVVLVPGFTGSKEDFVAVLAPIGEAGFPVVAYDQRGQLGTQELSPGPAPEGWTMDAYGADLLAVAAQVAGPDRPVHLLGHSFGGLVARNAVLTGTGRFASLVLLGSGPASIGPEPDALLRAMADGLDALGLAPVWTVLRARAREAGEPEPTDPDVAEFLERRFLAHDVVGLAAMARLLAAEPDRTAELAAAAPPRRLVAFGEADDAWSPEIQRETASRLAALTVSFPEAAHSPAAEAPEATAKALLAFWMDSEGAGQPPQAEEEL